jgi:hypothetical protein
MKKVKEAHTSPSKIGMGDYYGIGVKNPIGKIRDVTDMEELSPRKLKKPPRSLA